MVMESLKKEITKSVDELLPERIKAIRDKLRLSQAEAGKVIGGGPRAFTKYEAGTVKPSAAIVKLLKVLEDNPAALEMLTGKKLNGGAKGGRSPFEVSGKHIEELNAVQLVHLARRLLAAEAFCYSIPAAKIHAPENITAPDGGEDARIEWSGGPESTRYLRCRLNQFQMKSGKIDTKTAGKEVLDKQGSVKKMVRTVLEADGVYVLLCSHGYTQAEIQKKEKAIHVSLEEAGLKVKNKQISFYDSSMIAEWVNTHPSVAIWLLEQTEMGSIGKFRSWEYWKSSPEHAVQLIEDPRLTQVQEKLIPAISTPNSVRRIIGPSGAGKSRLVLESFQKGNDDAPTINDLILYIDEQIVEANAVKLAVQNLADSSTRAIIIVDRCPIETHRELSNLVKRSESKLSLLTIDDEGPFIESDETIVIKTADNSVIETILKKIAPNLRSQARSEDLRRLVKFSQGFPKIAMLLGESWAKDTPLANTDEDMAKAIVVGREQVESDLLLRGAEILSVFGIVYESELESIFNLSRGVDLKDLRRVIKKLENRGIVQRKGKAFVIQPRPVALCLAEMMWFAWGEDGWDGIILGPLPDNIKVRAIKQLAFLNTRPSGVEIGRHLLRRDGPLDSIEKISQPEHAEIFSELSEVDADAAVSLLERLFNGISSENLRKVDGDTRRHLVWALGKICFSADTFERGAKIMLDFAVAENESWGNNATGQFKAFFPVNLGDTSADAEKRLRVIKDALDTENEQQLLIVTEALLSGAELNHFSRSVGAETHGSRPALESWQPETYGDLWNYIESFCDHLIDLAKRTDSVGISAKKGLGYKFRSLANKNLLHIAEKAVREITIVHGNYWPEAYGGLGDVFEYDREGLDKDTDERIQVLIELLQPDSLEGRVRLLLTEMPWDYPCEQKMSYKEKEEKQKEAVIDFTTELLKAPDDLKKAVSLVCYYSDDGRTGQRRTTPLFGKVLAQELDDPVKWLNIIMAEIKKIETRKRDLDFLSGFLCGLNEAHPEIVEKFKKDAATSNDFAPALPSICSRIDIHSNDIPLIITALKNGSLEPWHLWQWSCGGVLARCLSPSEISPLLDFLMSEGGDGLRVGLDLMGMYAHGQYDILNEFIPQIKLAAEMADTSDKSDSGSKMDEHHFQNMMQWVLKKGRDNPEARAIALTLSRQLIKLVDDGDKDLIKPLVPQLLSDFPEISWPLIGQAIISDRKTAWRFEHLLGSPYSFGGKQNPPLLNLPEDTLFAWCHANPDIAPAFVSVVVPVLTSQNPEDVVRTLHPIMHRLLNEFGDREDVLSGISRNIGTYGWSGSRTTYYELYELPMKELENHPIKQVRFWAQKMIQNLGLQKSAARDEDEEQEAHWSV